MLTDVLLKKSYDSEKDSIIDSFYNPVLMNSIYYRRIAGFFSSASLIAAAKGIAYFFENNGKYELITGAIVSKSDYEAIKAGYSNLKIPVQNDLSDNSINLLSEIERDHLKILSWLVATGRLVIKIAIIEEDNQSLFHQKIGILEDKDGNLVSFSGSINETGAAWDRNIEEFKVFRSWDRTESIYLEKDLVKFNNYWSGNTDNIQIVDMPTAIKNNLLKLRPTDNEVKGLIEKIKKRSKMTDEEINTLYDYQIKAIEKWNDNNNKGILEMATGTGKTLTSINAIKNVYLNNEELCLIVAVPYKHLIHQWKKDIADQLPGFSIIEAYSDNFNWKVDLKNYLTDYSDGFLKKIIIITTYTSLSNQTFLMQFEMHFNKNKTYALIADEVHNFGSETNRKGMIPSISIRLGLSATPTRWLDEEGTNTIMSYFGKTVFKFTLKDAITFGALTPYEYYPIFVSLEKSELDEYVEISKKIKPIYDKESSIDEYTKLLLFKRSKIIKKSNSKYHALRQILTELLEKYNEIKNLLIYCDSTKQLENVQAIVNEFGVPNHKFTEKESISERNDILKKFDDGAYGCLVAMKCLDEGVNVPSTKIAIILASSSNPREFIQRRGRVLRKYPNKKRAYIYDFVVVPDGNKLEPELANIERKILKNELNRMQEFIDSAINKNFILTRLGDIMLRNQVYLD